MTSAHEDARSRAHPMPRFVTFRRIALTVRGGSRFASLAPKRGAPIRGMPSIAAFALVAVLGAASPRAAADEATARPINLETQFYGYPARAVTELPALLAQAGAGPSARRRYLYALYGQSLVAAGRNGEAIELAQRIEHEANARGDDLAVAAALLVRSQVELWGGDSMKANALAKRAWPLVNGAADPYLAYWAAMTIGITARGRGHFEEALGSLQQALAAAEGSDNALRRSHAHYQLSTLYLAMKQPQNALDASLEAFRFAERAGSAPAMANARMAESAAMEILEEPVRELAAMEEALAIARKAQSKVAEGLALINLADIRLRRRQFQDALDLSRRSLAVAREFDDVGAMATSKANMGFALFGLGRTSEGKRLADEALADYERSGASAEIASLLGEYSRYLEQSGDYRAALVLYHRERKLYEEIAAAAHQKSVLEMQEKYESEKRLREIELLNRQNALNAAELENRRLRERVWWLLALAFAVSFIVVAALYRKLRVTNGLLALKNRDLSVRSSRDPLTSLYNRRYFQEYMRDEHSGPDRRRDEGDDSVHALMLIDIDLFKQINDRYGHATGDAVLVAVARRLRETLRETDMIVRWGGEEFLVFVPAIASERLDEVAMRIMHAISSEPIAHQRHAIRITASIGYAPFPLPPDDVMLSWERAISLVDMALYMAKVHGRNRAYGIRGLRHGDGDSLNLIERDLERAWESGMVDMHVVPGPEPGASPVGDPPGVVSRGAD